MVHRVGGMAQWVTFHPQAQKTHVMVEKQT